MKDSVANFVMRSMVKSALILPLEGVLTVIKLDNRNNGFVIKNSVGSAQFFSIFICNTCSCVLYIFDRHMTVNWNEISALFCIWKRNYDIMAHFHRSLPSLYLHVIDSLGFLSWKSMAQNCNLYKDAAGSLFKSSEWPDCVWCSRNLNSSGAQVEGNVQSNELCRDAMDCLLCMGALGLQELVLFFKSS